MGRMSIHARLILKVTRSPGHRRCLQHMLSFHLTATGASSGQDAAFVLPGDISRPELRQILMLHGESKRVGGGGGGGGAVSTLSQRRSPWMTGGSFRCR